MTIERADLDGLSGPKYVAIADAIGRRVSDGHILPGARLPPQRELARALGVTVGTVGRGYAEARRRGLLTGEVGRGTYVRGPRPRSTWGMPHGEPGAVCNLAHNEPHFADTGELLRASISAWSGTSDLADALGYAAQAGNERHRRAGAAWLARCGVDADPADVVVTAGAQHAMLAALGSVVEPGDVVLAESVAYQGLGALARFLRVRLEGVPLDDFGIVPGAFADLCASARPKAAYLTPTIQNPTGASMPAERRAEIAAIAREHDVHLVEDDSYGFLAAEPTPPLATFAPERSTYLTSLSKPVSPGLRIGFAWRRDGGADALASTVLTTTIMASPITADLAAHLLADGTADRVVAARRREVRERQALGRRILGEHVASSCSTDSPHLWVPLPDPWRAEEFTERARARGVAVASSEIFAVGRAAAPHAVRVSLGAVPRVEDLERALTTLADLLSRPPVPSFGGV